MIYKKLSLVGVALCVLGMGAHTAVYGAVNTATQSQDTTAFTLVQDIASLNISTATVVELPLDTRYHRKNFAIIDSAKNTPQPYLYKENSQMQSSIASIKTQPENSDAQRLIDGNTLQYIEFGTQSDGMDNSIEMRFESNKPLTSSAFSMTLQQYAHIPKTVSVSVLQDGSEKVVLAQTNMASETVRFPETTASSWILRFTFVQPLRVSELSFYERNAHATDTQSIRFLAQPGVAYTLYAAPDRYVAADVSEAGNLADNKDVLMLKKGMFRENKLYKQADSDNDSIVDTKDNCVQMSNADQADINKNGTGDVCDDFDKDGVLNAQDNCKNIPNAQQIDTDGDGAGDACDTEESRMTEKYAWLPWMVIGIVACVVAGLFVNILRRQKQ